MEKILGMYHVPSHSDFACLDDSRAKIECLRCQPIKSSSRAQLNHVKLIPAYKRHFTMIV